ncbi:MAG TPA: (4Fe-4S)-binding protein [Flavobacterium sp.]|jgi:uncharacterized Fe-S cluster protein YjdI
MATKEYTNGEMTIVWKPELCTHSAFCAHGLPLVFQPKVKPWIKADAATTAEMIAQVGKCPSSALSFYMNPKIDPDGKSGIDLQ